MYYRSKVSYGDKLHSIHGIDDTRNMLVYDCPHNNQVLCENVFFRVFTIVGVVVDAPEYELCHQRSEEQFLVRVRHCILRNGVDLAVQKSYRKLWLPLFRR